MEYKIFFEKEQMVIRDLAHFEPKHIFECGQCFRWNREEDGSYTGVAFDRTLNVRKIGKDVFFKNTSQADFDNIWLNYFDFNTDYEQIKRDLSHQDPVMRKAIEFGYGIRILKQDPWETVVSFIISSNNNIPRIKKAIELLSERHGRLIGEFKGKKRYAFPNAERIARLTIEELEACNVGYRASYVQKTAARVLKCSETLFKLKELDTDLCEKELMDYNGIGPKVANCILLFCMEKREVFPIDVWIKRIMEHFYFFQETAPGEIKEFAHNKFGPYTGYAQQYLFYYARELGLGRK
jgi:N-glycosylase/DNA lyase